MEKRDHRRGRDGGRDDRQDDAAQNAERRAAVDHRRFFNIGRNEIDRVLQEPSGDGQGERGVGEDKPDMRIQEAERAKNREQRHDENGFRQHLRHEQRDADEKFSAEREARHRIAHGQGEQQGHDGGAGRDDGAVAQPVGNGADPERFGEDADMAGIGKKLRFFPEESRVGRHGRHDHPVEGKNGEAHERDHARDRQRRADAMSVHADGPAFASRSVTMK